MGKTLIYKDAHMIEDHLLGYKKGIATLQAIIDSLAGQGIALSDNVLKDLYSGGIETKDRVLCQIEEEVAAVKFQVLKDEIRKSTEALPYKIDEAVHEVRNALNVARGNFTISIDLDHLVVKGLKITTVSDFEHIITEKFSIYADSPEMAEAYERALKLEKELNDFADWLKTQGDALRPVTDRSMIGVVLHQSVITISPDGRASIQPSAFRNLFAKRIKPQ